MRFARHRCLVPSDFIQVDVLNSHDLARDTSFSFLQSFSLISLDFEIVMFQKLFFGGQNAR